MYFFFIKGYIYMPVNSNELNPVKEYSGYAICDKEENSRELKVFCPDLLPFHTGKLLPTDATVRVVNSSNTSSTYSNDVCESNYITCTYRDDSSNHTAFPPDVRAGEQVTVIKLGDNEQQYFWKPCARTEGNRRTETHRIAISGTLDNDTVLNNDNSYYFEMDTRRSHSITLSTNKADGEQFKYMLKIDADNNLVMLGDDVGNAILIDSAGQSITMQTKSGATIQIQQNDTNTSCNGNLSMQVKGNVTQTIKGNVSLECDGSVAIKSKGAISLTSGSKIDLVAPSINVSKGGSL